MAAPRGQTWVRLTVPASAHAPAQFLVGLVPSASLRSATEKGGTP
jgi:hypothetical protein